MLERGLDMAELGQLVERGNVQPVGVGAHRGLEGPSVVGPLGIVGVVHAELGPILPAGAFEAAVLGFAPRIPGFVIAR